MADENVFKYDKTKRSRGTHVNKTMEKILRGTSRKWKELIEDESLKKAVKGLVKYYEASGRQKVLPSQANQILAALNYCEPEKVKVIILGHDPIWADCGDQPLATGLAFSFPDGITEDKITELRGPGRSVLDVHTALKQAGIEPGESCCHEHWAERGVLLLNACLTIDPENRTERRSRSGKIENPHFKHWESFIYNLLLKFLRNIDKERPDFAPVYVLCWGTHARDVGRDLKEELGSPGEWNDDHAGLLNPPHVIFIGHHPTYPTGAENKFIKQATYQFEVIMQIIRYDTLFNQETEEERRRRKKKEERRKKEEEEEEERRKKKEQEEEEEERRNKKKKKEEGEDDHQDDVNQLSDTVASGMHINK